MNFGKILRELRTQNNYSAENLSKILGCSKSLVYEWEKERSQPSTEALLHLSEIFDVSVDYLLGRESDFVGISEKTERLTGQLTDRKLKFGNDELSPDEQNLIECFRKLDVYQRGAIEIQITALAEQAEKIKK